MTPPETPVAAPDVPALRHIELGVTGMTCASCANRIERKLNKLDGVDASVNYATEKAHVSYPGGTDVADLLADLEQALAQLA